MPSVNQVMSVSIKRDRATGKNLGYGFVKLSSHQEARAAKEAMQVSRRRRHRRRRRRRRRTVVTNSALRAR